jgi:hypothetical protein
MLMHNSRAACLRSSPSVMHPEDLQRAGACDPAAHDGTGLQHHLHVVGVQSFAQSTDIKSLIADQGQELGRQTRYYFPKARPPSVPGWPEGVWVRTASMRERAAMYNANALKVGLFGANCS